MKTPPVLGYGYFLLHSKYKLLIFSVITHCHIFSLMLDISFSTAQPTENQTSQDVKKAGFRRANKRCRLGTTGTGS